MKKLFLILILPFFCLSQNIKLPAYQKVEEVSNTNTDKKEVWLKTDVFYSMSFEENPIGIKHLMEQIRAVLKENGVDFKNQFLNKSYLASYNQDMDDYGRTNVAIQSGDSEIDITWFIERSPIFINLKKGDYSIRFMNRL